MSVFQIEVSSLFLKKCSIGETGAHGRTCTRTGDVLDVVSLLLDYMGVKVNAVSACRRVFEKESEG